MSQSEVMRKAIVIVLLAGFAGWFAYDGWYTYPHRNLNQAQTSFPKEPQGPVTANPAVTEESAKAVDERMRSDLSRETTVADLSREWGEPAYVGPADASGTASSPQVAFFVGPYGWVKATLSGQRVSDVAWFPASKNESEIMVQKLLAGVLALAAAIPLALLLLQMSRKYVLDDEGLVAPGAGRIAYARMTGLDTGDLAGRGIVRLQYTDERGEAKALLLDEEKMRKFDEIVLALCEKKGWQVETEETSANG